MHGCELLPALLQLVHGVWVVLLQQGTASFLLSLSHTLALLACGLLCSILAPPPAPPPPFAAPLHGQ